MKNLVRSTGIRKLVKMINNNILLSVFKSMYSVFDPFLHTCMKMLQQWKKSLTKHLLCIAWHHHICKPLLLSVNIRSISQCFQKTHSHNQFSRSLHFWHPKCLYTWIEAKALFSKIISSGARFIISSHGKHMHPSWLPWG